MDTTNRIRQVIGLGLPVYCGSRFERRLDHSDLAKAEIAGVWDDGSKELIYRWCQNGTAHDVRRRYKAELRAILCSEGIDSEKLTEKLPQVDLHVLKVSDGSTYEFFLPSRRYYEDRNKKRTLVDSRLLPQSLF